MPNGTSGGVGAGDRQRSPATRSDRDDQVARVAQESVREIEQIARYLLHPIPVRSDANPCDLHRAGLHLDHEEHHVSDCPERAQRLYAEEVARV
jgi:hypothetical protein